MRLHDVCIALSGWVYDIQSSDPETHGKARPRQYKGSLSASVFSLVYTSFGRDEAPAQTSDVPGFNKTLKGRFLDRLERDACRKEYQGRLTELEDVLDKSLPKMGDEKVVEMLAVKMWPTGLFLPALQKAGFRLRDPERLERLLKAAEIRGAQMDAEFAARHRDGLQP